MVETRPKVCAVITEETAEAAKLAIKRAAGLADIIELRLDYLRDFDFENVERLHGLLENKPLPVIITCRDSSEGGWQKIDERIRLRLLVEGAKRFADYCDIEAAHYKKAERLLPDLSKLIVSYHDFTKTPDNLNEIYEWMKRFPAAVYKIATRANHVGDTLAVFRLLKRALDEKVTLLALAMGEAGLLTRLLGPSRGSFLTFGTLDGSRKSAPGQISCEELKSLYRIHRLTPKTPIIGIVGNPVNHSASPALHNSAFSALNRDFVYLPIEVDNLGDFFRRFVRPETRELDWDLRGFSVTIPHKIAVMPLLDEIDPTAQEIGAVNTVLVSNGRLQGFNTDVYGAIDPLRGVIDLKGARCAVIGAGGAARAVVYGLVAAGAFVTVFARDVEKAKPLADSFGVLVSPLDRIGIGDLDILINTTPVGMHGYEDNHCLVSHSALSKIQIVYDLVYNPMETRLLCDARAAGCVTIGGLDMLVAQAALQFKLWTGDNPPMETMREAARKKLHP